MRLFCPYGGDLTLATVVLASPESRFLPGIESLD
jgi:hypothetical protein